jgi:hypothetical protein
VARAGRARKKDLTRKTHVRRHGEKLAKHAHFKAPNNASLYR